MPNRQVTSESWEGFDAEALFSPPTLHTNKVIQIDQKDLNKVDRENLDEFGAIEPSAEQGEPQDGDSYTDAAPDQGHVDEMYQMDGLEGGEADERELKADKEEDRRTEKSSDEKEAQEAEQAEGVEKPIQKEKEDVNEVAEATSKTSEDVHGGDEATKDIEDSPNAADDGENTENKGAESGKDGEEGEGSEGESQQPSDNGDQAGQPQGDSTDANAEGTDPMGNEDWEAKADQIAETAALEHGLLNWEAHEPPQTSAGGGKGVDYRSYNQWTPESARTIFLKVRELIKKLVEEEDTSHKVTGNARWWAKQLVDETIAFRHHRIPSAKYEYPHESNIVFFVDISGSVSHLAELFMALMGGAAGIPGVRIVVGSEAHAEREIVVPKPFKTVEAAIAFFRHALSDGEYESEHPMGGITLPKGGWKRPYENPFEPGVVAYLQDNNLYNANTTCIFFGDMQGVHFDTPELRKIVRTCKCLWLFTDEQGHYTHTGDLPKAIEAKLPIVYNVKEARTFAKAVRRFQSIRPGLQIVP